MGIEGRMKSVRTKAVARGEWVRRVGRSGVVEVSMEKVREVVVVSEASDGMCGGCIGVPWVGMPKVGGSALGERSRICRFSSCSMGLVCALLRREFRFENTCWDSSDRQVSKHSISYLRYRFWLISSWRSCLNKSLEPQGFRLVTYLKRKPPPDWNFGLSSRRGSKFYKTVIV